MHSEFPVLFQKIGKIPKNRYFFEISYDSETDFLNFSQKLIKARHFYIIFMPSYIRFLKYALVEL